jgi:hypothetical protein
VSSSSWWWCGIGVVLLGGCGSEEPPASECGISECIRNIECVAECGGPVLSSGCCACLEGSFDRILCSAPVTDASRGARAQPAE